MKYLISNIEILNKFKAQNPNVLNIGTFDIGYCLEFRNSEFGFTPERSL